MVKPLSPGFIDTLKAYTKDGKLDGSDAYALKEKVNEVVRGSPENAAYVSTAWTAAKKNLSPKDVADASTAAVDFDKFVGKKLNYSVWAVSVDKYKAQFSDPKVHVFVDKLKAFFSNEPVFMQTKPGERIEISPDVTQRLSELEDAAEQAKHSNINNKEVILDILNMTKKELQSAQFRLKFGLFERLTDS